MENQVSKDVWFNNVTLTRADVVNGWKVFEAVTKNGHKVRGITKSEKTNGEVGTKVNMMIRNVNKATYVNVIIARKEA